MLLVCQDRKIQTVIYCWENVGRKYQHIKKKKKVEEKKGLQNGWQKQNGSQKMS